jgi:hypothetical protein
LKERKELNESLARARRNQGSQEEENRPPDQAAWRDREVGDQKRK